MAEINQTLTQLKLEPANTKNLKSFVGELNGNLKILEKGFGVKIFQNGNKVSISGNKESIKKASNAIQDLYATTTKGIELSKETIQMAINNNDDILIYDNSDLKSSCRCWFSLIYFGHDEKKIHILNGGLKKWIFENKPITKDATEIIESNYVAN